MLIGLLMVSHEDDILADVLASHERIVDVFYALDGTLPANVSHPIIQLTGERKCAGYWHDLDLDLGAEPVRDGARQTLLNAAYQDHGTDHWFLLLHGDEVWTFDPQHVVDAHPGVDGFRFRLPLCYAPMPWDASRPALEQMTGTLRPGYPEFRMFHGGPSVRFDPGQHFNTQPAGLVNVAQTEAEILHYPYRSPESQLARAAATFDPDNYAGCPLDGPAIEERFLGRSDIYAHA